MTPEERVGELLKMLSGYSLESATDRPFITGSMVTVIRMAVAAAVRKAVAEEREAIAQHVEFSSSLHSDPYCGPFGDQMASMIRKRGET